jgi:uncharacterized short protein YbdD (DUF466 family)
MAKLNHIVRTALNYLREILGEKAYSRYCEYIRSRGGQPMDAEEFYRQQLEAKYSRPNRCC